METVVCVCVGGGGGGDLASCCFRPKNPEISTCIQERSIKSDIYWLNYISLILNAFSHLLYRTSQVQPKL